MNARELLSERIIELGETASLSDVLHGKIDGFTAQDISSINIQILRASIDNKSFNEKQNTFIGTYFENSVNPLEYFCLLQACLRTNFSSPFTDTLLKDYIKIGYFIVETLVDVKQKPEEYKERVEKAIVENKSFQIISDMVKQIECAERFSGMWNINPYMLLVEAPRRKEEKEEDE